MKLTNLNSRVHEKQNLKPESTNTIKKGITMRLLEKYKPKHLYKMETIRDRKNGKRVA